MSQNCIARIIDESDTVQEVQLEPVASGLDFQCEGICLTSRLAHALFQSHNGTGDRFPPTICALDQLLRSQLRIAPEQIEARRPPGHHEDLSEEQP